MSSGHRQSSTGIGASRLSVPALKNYIRKHGAGTGHLKKFSDKMKRPELLAFISNVLKLNLNRVTVNGPSAPKPQPVLSSSSNSNNSNYKQAHQGARKFLKNFANSEKLNTSSNRIRKPFVQKNLPATLFNRVMQGPAHMREIGLKQLSEFIKNKASSNPEKTAKALGITVDEAEKLADMSPKNIAMMKRKYNDSKKPNAANVAMRLYLKEQGLMDSSSDDGSSASDKEQGNYAANRSNGDRQAKCFKSTKGWACASNYARPLNKNKNSYFYSAGAKKSYKSEALAGKRVNTQMARGYRKAPAGKRLSTLKLAGLGQAYYKSIPSGRTGHFRTVMPSAYSRPNMSLKRMAVAAKPVAPSMYKPTADVVRNRLQSILYYMKPVNFETKTAQNITKLLSTQLGDVNLKNWKKQIKTNIDEYMTSKLMFKDDKVVGKPKEGVRMKFKMSMSKGRDLATGKLQNPLTRKRVMMSKNNERPPVYYTKSQRGVKNIFSKRRPKLQAMTPVVSTRPIMYHLTNSNKNAESASSSNTD
jgi:hypothetical protein